MATEGSGTSTGHDELGRLLAGMRKAKRLSGAALAKLVGMSQPKISRLENGVGLPDPADVAKIARALEAEPAEIARLVELAERSHDLMTDLRPYSAALADRQQDIGQEEARARTIRVFHPVIIVGLLQTSEYARAILTSVRPLHAPDSAAASDAAVASAVSERIRRQEILTDPSRTFHFVMAETALSNRVCPPEHMAAQIRRLRDVAKQENVTLSIIPSEAEWPIAPYHSFELLDDETTVIDLFNTALRSRGKTNSRVYRLLFDTFAELATDNLDAILDRHLERYLRLLRASSNMEP